MAFLSLSHPPHRAGPEVTITLSPADRDRLADFSVATYRSDGQMHAALALTDLPTRVDPATGWMWCRVAAELTHPQVAGAVALMDTQAEHRVTAFYALDCAAPVFVASDGPAAGLASGCFPNSGGLPLPFDSTMTSDTMQNSLLIGTLIDTAQGPRPIEELEPGDLIKTRDNGPQPLRHVHSQTIAGLPFRSDRRLWPVRIEAGALGFGLPRRDLWVGQQQPMLYRHLRVRQVIEQDSVLVQAHALAAGLDGVTVAQDHQAITAFHLVFDDPQVIFAEGAATCSYDPAPQQAQDQPEALPHIRSWELLAMVG